MANKRTLKKTINLICDEMLVDCIAAIHYGVQHRDNTTALLFSIIRMQDDFIARVSHPEPGMPPKRYYGQLRERFSAQASEMLDQIHL